MFQKKGLFLLFLFCILAAAIFVIGQRYKDLKVSQHRDHHYKMLSTSLHDEVKTLIEEKRNATLSLAISLAEGNNIATYIEEKKEAKLFLSHITQSLKETTDFKNVWIQLVDKEGVCLSRSWTNLKGDKLSHIRSDVAEMILNPQTKTSISVGRFDMTLKSMVPVYREDAEFVGFIEVITHFNSISRKIRAKGFEAVILVDEKYKDQITDPFTKIFAGDFYVANKDADKSLVEYIESQGIKYFKSNGSAYMIDKERDLFVVNYLLFDTQKQPMAHFLMFRPLQSISDGSIETIKANIDLVMVFFIFLIAFMLYLFWNKEGVEIDLKYSRYILVFVLLFLLASLVYALLLNKYFETKKDDFFLAYNNAIQRDLSIINNNFSRLAKSLFETVVNKQEVLNTMAEAHKQEEMKNKARENLHKMLQKEYQFFTSFGIRQLHFQLKNNESFLRFHRPQKYGDNLSGIRATIEWVNNNLTPIEGFEEGRIFNGFRHVYPLIDVNELGRREHVGSVEIAFSAYVLAREFMNAHHAKAAFLITTDVVQEKVFESEKSNYGESEIDGFLYEKKIKKQFENIFAYADLTRLHPKDIQQLSQRIFKGEIFSLPSHDLKAILTFIPFKNPVSTQIASVMILENDDSSLGSYANQFLILLLTGVGAILFAFLYIYKEFISKHKFRELSQKTQKILDAQDALVVITDGKTILDVNKRFLEFFAFKSLEDMDKGERCICQYFEENDKFFHLKKVRHQEYWLETLSALPNKDHIVSMRDSKGAAHSFVINMSRFEQNYILSFSDISETMHEHFTLEKKATHDTLTNAYNREYFEKSIDPLIDEAKRADLHLGVLIFDIDHFKDVNDTYGHTVGDLILKKLVKTVHHTIRAEDMLIRWGGEEFLLLAKVQSLETLLKLAEHIRTTIENTSFEEVERITCSFGVTLYQEEEKIQDAIRRADEALYEAKRSGRNQVLSSK
ncbi:MAG: diguanylate cyclase [Sulfurimonas sp.]|nr:diguanylate cyclase [Sulfurimonas sp.]